MQPIGFWAFVWLCIGKAAKSTRTLLEWNVKTCVLGACTLILGFFLYWWKFGKSGAQIRAWDDVVWIIAPMIILAIGIFIFNLLRSPVLVYRAEQEKVEEVKTKARELDNALLSLADKLRIEQDRNRPIFEVTCGTSIMGNDTLTDGKTTEYHTHVFLPVTVLNHGAPSIIRNLRFTATLKDGRAFEGFHFIPTQKELVFNMPDGHLAFLTTDSLISRGTVTPIPTGGQADGFIYYEFPAGLLNDFHDPETIFSLEVKDIASNIYILKVPGGRSEGKMATSPNLRPIPRH